MTTRAPIRDGYSGLLQKTPQRKRPRESDAGKTRCRWHGLCDAEVTYAASGNIAFRLKTDTDLFLCFLTLTSDLSNLTSHHMHLVLKIYQHWRNNINDYNNTPVSGYWKTMDDAGTKENSTEVTRLNKVRFPCRITRTGSKYRLLVQSWRKKLRCCHNMTKSCNNATSLD